VQQLLAKLPRVDHVLGKLSEHPARRSLQKKCIEVALNRWRQRLGDGKGEVPTAGEVADEVRGHLATILRPSPTAVINATGVVLHTNLGRAPLAAAAIAAMNAAAGACDLEIDRKSGRRRSRLAPITELAAYLCGAEDVLLVNNGGAALLLACTALAGPGGVALSRGQMVEIGDSFRVADMAAAAGTPVIAVGSTNRTHLRDYESACTTGGAKAILWAHRSNFTQHGFVGEPSLPDLGKLAHTCGVPLIADLGSGNLHRGEGAGEGEPAVADVLAGAAGADVVTCSGDKLLGGPQAGILAGTRALIESCRRHPMARALRMDKVSLAALHATLAIHATRPEARTQALPLAVATDAAVLELRSRAKKIVTALNWPATTIADVSDTIGGGSLPGQTLPGVALRIPEGLGAATTIAGKLRQGEPAVFTRVHLRAVWVHLRTVPPELDTQLIEQLAWVARSP